jgi:putative hemin transport protein
MSSDAITLSNTQKQLQRPQQPQPTPPPLCDDPRAALRARAAITRAEHPNMRARDLARTLGTSEAALLDAHVGHWVTPLRADHPTLLGEIEALGVVMALTRNEHAVIERDGRYEGADLGPNMGQVVSEAIDLRLFFRHWRWAFAVEQPSARGVLRSIQWFDAHGDALHKVFLRPTSDLTAFHALVTRHGDPTSPPLTPRPRPAPIPERPDAQIDTPALREAWASMQNTHDFFGLTRRFQVSRIQALRLADPRMVTPLKPRLALPDALRLAADSGLPIMVFIGNLGCIQIHTGPIHNILEAGEWLNVLDPGFNLHIHQPGIAQAMIVRKPTADGLVSSLELYDHDGEVVALLFGERKPGRAERAEWRAILDRLTPLNPIHAQP